jgi:hypothetical protein
MPAAKTMEMHEAEKPAGKTKGVTKDGEANAEELVMHGWQRSGAGALVRAA